MVESPCESTVVWVHKVRVALFLSAMRHFADALRNAGYTVHYRSLSDTGKNSLVDEVEQVCQQHGYTSIDMAEPGEWRLEQDFCGLPGQPALNFVCLKTHIICAAVQNSPSGQAATNKCAWNIFTGKCENAPAC